MVLCIRLKTSWEAARQEGPTRAGTGTPGLRIGKLRIGGDSSSLRANTPLGLEGVSGGRYSQATGPRAEPLKQQFAKFMKSLGFVYESAPRWYSKASV